MVAPEIGLFVLAVHEHSLFVPAGRRRESCHMIAPRGLVPRHTVGSTALCAFNDQTPDLFHGWLNDPELINNMGDWSFMPAPYQNRSAEKYCEAVRDTTWLICAIEEPKLVPIGYTGILVRQRHRIGVFRIAIAERRYRGQGHASRATHLFLDWAFRYLDLFAVHLSVTSSNMAALQLYKKCGFAEVGRYSEARYEPNGRFDEVHMELLRRDWAPTVTAEDGPS